MCPLLLIALLQAHLAASCGPVVARTPIINSSGAKARSDQRAREFINPLNALITFLPDDKFESTAESPTVTSPPPTDPSPTEPSLRHPFPPFDPRESFGDPKSVPRGTLPREPPRRFTFPPSDPEASFSPGKSLPPDDLPRDCADVQNSGGATESGVYRIYRPSCLNPERCGKDVNCDLQTDGGGWTIIQQRTDDSTNFFREWKDYRNGFGDSHNFWIGNEYLYEVTTMLGQSYNLLVQLTDFDGRSKIAVYDKFAVSDEVSNYTLSLGKMFDEEEEVDNFLANRNAPFGTYEQDTDEKEGDSCGAIWRSGWWHDPLCRPSGNLNVPYEPSTNFSAPTTGLRWRDSTGSIRVKSVQMKIRPKSFNPLLFVSVRSRNKNDDNKNDGDKNDSSKNDDKSSAAEPTLRLNFRSLSDTRKKSDLQSALWRRFRL